MSGSARSRAEPKQLFLPTMFLPHEEEAIEQILNDQLRRKLANQVRYRTRVAEQTVKPRKIDSMSASLFDLPLGLVEDVELSTPFDPYDEDIAMDKPHLTDEEAMTWSEDAINQLHEGMVMYSLRLLNARGNGKEKKAILSWIFDPHAMAYAVDLVGDEPLWEIIQPSEVPFGFELCCRLSGFDPERIREGLAPILKELDLDELFKEVEHERNTEQRIRATKVSHTLNIQYSRSAGKCGDSGIEAGAPRSAESGPALCLRDGETA